MAKIVDPEAMRSHIARSVGDLPALPSVVSRVLTLTDDPHSSASALQKVVSSDQALSGKILRVVNSAFYAVPCPIASITHAVMVLGEKQLRNLTISLAAMSMVKARSRRTASHQTAVWRHSLAVASAAQAIARHTKARGHVTDEAFTGGLLHDIGRLFLLGFFADFYEEIAAHAKEERLSIVAAERELLGLDHMEIGGMLAEHWNFPQSLCTMIRTHHEPSRAGEHFELTACIHLADVVAVSVEPSEGDAGPIVDESAEAWAQLTDDVVADVVAELSANVMAAGQIIGIAA